MALHHITVTLGTGATAILTPAAGLTSVNVTELQVESETGNAAVQIGGLGVTATDYGRTISAGPSSALTFRPGAGTMLNLASTYLIGTNGQKVHCAYIVP